LFNIYYSVLVSDKTFLQFLCVLVSYLMMYKKLLLKGLKVIGAGSFIAGPVSTTILSELCPASAIVMTKDEGRRAS